MGCVQQDAAHREYSRPVPASCTRLHAAVRAAVSVCADKMAPSTVLLRISAFYSDILQIYMSPGMRKLILVHTDLDR